MSKIGHNSGHTREAQDKLKSYVERMEALIQDRRNINDDLATVRAEAKAMGFDTKIIAKLIKERARSKEDRREEHELLETYAIALGFDLL